MFPPGKCPWSLLDADGKFTGVLDPLSHQEGAVGAGHQELLGFPPLHGTSVPRD